ncbi:MAG: GPW/gp25 family protein [Bacteroidota bacterium]
MATYLKIPIKFQTALKGDNPVYCSANESIIQNIELIIITKYGEQRNNPLFGCGIWDLDFDLMTDEDEWKEQLRTGLLAAIKNYEPRLVNVDMDIKISSLNKQYKFEKFPSIKKSVAIEIKAMINQTGKPFQLKTNLYLSPLAKK